MESVLTIADRVDKAASPQAGPPARSMLLQNTVQVMRAFAECSDSMQSSAREMLAVILDPQTDPEEKAAAADTLLDILYPEYAADGFGIDSTTLAELDRSTDPATNAELDGQEQAFADRLRSLMVRQGLTQQQLADRVGVGQPAIANMLARECRPQMRTVQRLAKALGVGTDDLWPQAPVTVL
jgi:DNA-binding XRE family transcriptional regulator